MTLTPPDHFSPSAAETFESCPKKWFFKYVHRVEDPAGPAARIGSMAHDVLEQVTKLPSGARTPAAALAVADQLWKDDPPPARRAAWGHIARALRDVEVAHGEVIGVELELNVDLGGVPFSGRLDRVDALPSDAARILDYKGLALDTPIPTPSGWTTMAAVEMGDEVFGRDGRPCQVVVKSDIRSRPCFRLSFDDGSSIVADDEHAWAVESTVYGPIGVVATKDLPGMLRTATKRRRRHIAISNAAPLELPEADLPVDPWLLGYWLGNGKCLSGEVTWGEGAIEAVMAERGHQLGKVQVDRRSTGRSATVLGLRTRLRQLGLLGDKHVPDAYLRASASQRLDLLRGLLDSDGTWNKVRRQVVFVNLDKRLALAVYELAVSLGQRASWWEGRGSGFGKIVHQYRVSFTPTGINPFLTAKGSEVDLAGTTQSRRRLILSVEEVPSVPTACIAVDSPDHTYLAGEQMVPTHNTGKRPGRKDWLADKMRALLLYCAAYEAVWKRPVHEAALVWTMPFRIDEAVVTDVTVASAVRWFRGVWTELLESLEAEDFEARPGHLCSWCPGVMHCPEGQRAVAVRSKETDRSGKPKSIGEHGAAWLASTAWRSEAGDVPE